MADIQYFAIHRDSTEQPSGAIVRIGKARDSPHGDRHAPLVRGGKRERAGERESERGREGERNVCIRERERLREKVCVYKRERER